MYKSILVFAIAGLLITTASADPLKRQTQPTWKFGENLSRGDSFSYKICDSLIRIPISPGPCYDLDLEFTALLPSPTGYKWIISAQVDHMGLNKKNIHTNMIWQMDAKSFRVETDGTTIEYARSFERTIGWINQYASSFKPQILSVGKSWGTIKGDVENTDLQVTKINTDEFETYEVGYSLVKNSHVNVKDNFPFPTGAAVFKPVSTHQNIPLAFTFDLNSFYKSDSICKVVNPTLPEIATANNFTPSKNIIIQNKTAEDFKELLDDDTDDEFDVVSTNQIESIETNSTGYNE